MKTNKLLMCLLACWPSLAHAADAYPVRPVRLIIGFTAGGYLDGVARIFFRDVEKTLGQPFIVENRPGAAGQIAANIVAKSTPDGYTLLVAADSHSINAAMYKKLEYKPIDDFTFIRKLTGSPIALMVSAESPIKSVAEYVAAARKDPDGVNFATSGVGTGPHLTALRFASAAGIKISHIPYKASSESLLAIVQNQTKSTWGSFPAAFPYIADNRVRVLAIASTERSPLAPEVPTFEELGYKGMAASVWAGVMGPANLPGNVTEALERALHAAAEHPQIRQQIIDQQHLEIIDQDGAAFKAETIREIENVSQTVKQNNLLED
jgi:tripartite-type tricarboxylate transporter receptor subunit TctC